MKVWPGRPYPLGATWDGEGTNFAIVSEHSEAVDLLLFSGAEDGEPAEQIRLVEKTAHAWHGYLPAVGPGRLYAYRVHGPYVPQKGHRFNSAKVLIDPYARAIAGTVKWNDAVYGYRIGDPEKDLSKDDRDSCPFIPRSVVIDPDFDWEGDRLLDIPWCDTVIYEVHVKGFTARHPDVKDDKKGTYSGLASPAVLEYLTNLGITAIELLPVHHHVSDRSLAEQGLTNYWGYSTIGFFAPDCRYSSSGSLGQQVREFKEMVKIFHRAGIEVILDVVYNHTGEGNHFGPTLCFRGIDNAMYYRLEPDSPRDYMDFTGTGNSMNMNQPRVLQLIMDSLRYWVQEMHVDGFRFDLASTLARELYDVDRLSSFFDIVQQDPVLSQVKLIAEPWDLGKGGYQVGNFPPLWAEWNGKYRDTVRRFWRGDKNQMADLAYRLTGSSDLYERSARKPCASINFVTAHDGFTLSDLVSYSEKHNEANLEANRDGMNENLSWNCGAEGLTDNSNVVQLRERQKKNIMAMLLLSQGVPMVLGGDEIGRTQNGNNNAYCQDNEVSWLDWNLDDEKSSLLAFTRTLISIRRNHPVFKRRDFFQGKDVFGSDNKDIKWLRPDGREMMADDWRQPDLQSIGILLSGDEIDEMNERGEGIIDDTFLLLLNANADAVGFLLPGEKWRWGVELLTDSEIGDGPEIQPAGGEVFDLSGRSVVLLRQMKE